MVRKLRHHLCHDRESGASLMELMLSVAIVGINVAGVAGAFKLSQNAAISLKQRSELNRIRNDFLSNLDCTNTIGSINVASDCTTAAFTQASGYSLTPLINPRNASNTNLFTGNTYGQWSIRTVCVNNSTQKSLVAYASRNVNGSVTSDALTGKSQDWQPLFGQEVTLCEREIIGGAANATTQVAPALTIMGSAYHWSTTNALNYNYYDPNFYADINHMIGRFVRVVATCPTNYMPTNVYSTSAMFGLCRPSTQSYSADLTTLTMNWGCAFDEITSGNPAETNPPTVAMNMTCIRTK